MISFRRLVLATSGAVLLACIAPVSAQEATPEAPAADPSDVVARVGTEEITEGDLAIAAADLGAQFAQVPPEQRKLAVLSALIDIKVLAQEAEADALGDDPTIAARIDFLRERALHNAFFERNGVNAVTDEQLRARYDQEIAGLTPAEEVNASHILVPTREEAEAVIAELEGGADFATLAAENSTGPSGPQGGELGWFGPGQMVPPFEEAAFALEPGSYTTEPVETQFGWHVIRVAERRQQEPPAFEQVEDQIRQIVLREKYMELVEAGREELQVEYVDPALKAQIEALKAAAAQSAAEPEAGEAPAAGAAPETPAAPEAAPEAPAAAQ